MKPTMEILTKLQENSKKNHDEVFTRLYRYLLRPDIYYVAYQHLYSNKGAGTKGVTDDTADGFSEIYIKNIIGTYSDTITLPDGGNYIGIECENFTGNIELNIE